MNLYDKINGILVKMRKPFRDIDRGNEVDPLAFILALMAWIALVSFLVPIMFIVLCLICKFFDVILHILG